VLSKSRYLSGLQCPKRLWNEIHRRELLPPVDEAQQALFDQGHEVGKLAQRLFPGGMELARGRLDWQRAIAASREALGFRFPLYEAAFSYAGAACRVDILAPVGGDESNEWDLFEVKSTTSVKPVHVEDVAFQTWVLRGAGLRVRRSSLVHLDPGYVRTGEIDPEELFVVADLGAEIAPLLAELSRQVRELRAVEEGAAEPQVAIGPHCSDPYACPLVPHCWAHLPQPSVFDLHRGAARAWELYRDGVVELAAIPAGADLTERQRIQVAAARDAAPRVDRETVAAFLGRLEHPLHFLDFETFGLAIPPFDGVRPYQQVPFQFSLQRVEAAGSSPRPFSYLAPDGRDRRRQLVTALRAAIGERGSIVAYNAAFEKRVLRDCAAALPEHADWLAGLDERFVDLLEPFAAFAWYHPAQRGSASMKVVLPALTGRGYDDLEIQEGGLAARRFLRSNQRETPAAERERIRRALVDYCDRDTAGMVEIVARLREIAAGAG